MLTPRDEMSNRRSVRRRTVRAGCVADGALAHTRASDMSIKFAFRCFLIGSDAAGFDPGSRIILAFHGFTGDATEHRDLAHVSQCVGNRSLKKTFAGSIEF